MSKPFKMKGSPFQRNFNIGKTEAPDTESPYNKNSTPAKDNPYAAQKGGLKTDGELGILYNKHVKDKHPHSPAKGLADIDLGRASGAGMATLPGGHDAYNPGGKKEYERDENGKLIRDADGNPIEKEQEEKKSYTSEDLFGDITNFAGNIKDKNKQKNQGGGFIQGES